MHWKDDKSFETRCLSKNIAIVGLLVANFNRCTATFAPPVYVFTFDADDDDDH